MILLCMAACVSFVVLSYLDARIDRQSAEQRIADNTAAIVRIKHDKKQADERRYVEATRPIDDTNCAPVGKYADPARIDVVVNKRRCLSPLDYAPQELRYYQGIPVQARIYDDLVAMMQAMSAAGVPVRLTSAFRDRQAQQYACEGWIASTGSQTEADKNCARPGYSEHQTGLAVDFAAGGCVLDCLRATPQYTWLTVHAAEYGFIERYPLGYESFTGYHAEAWHYRYIGREAAIDMKSKSIQTLEQYRRIPGPGITPGVPGYATL